MFRCLCLLSPLSSTQRDYVSCKEIPEILNTTKTNSYIFFPHVANIMIHLSLCVNSANAGRVEHSQVKFFLRTFYPLSGVCLVSDPPTTFPTSGGHNMTNTCWIRWNPAEYLPQNTKASQSCFYQLQSPAHAAQQQQHQASNTVRNINQTLHWFIALTEGKQSMRVIYFELTELIFFTVQNCISSNRHLICPAKMTLSDVIKYTSRLYQSQSHI